MRPPALLPLLLLGACTRVSGTIDGQTVDGLLATYVEAEGHYGGDGLIIVYVAQLPEPCAVYTDFLDEFDEADSPEERAEAWRGALPEEFWELQVWLRVDDPDDDLTGAELDGVAWDEGLSDDDEAQVVARRFTDHPTEGSFAWWGGFTGESTDWFEGFVSDRGLVKIKGHDPGEAIRGSFSTEMVDDDGDDEGEITLSFTAERCRDAEDYLF